MPKRTPRSFTSRLKSFISSERCFRLIVLFFVLEAVWIALSGRYPMAFDEDFHLGVIQLYAHHISPFWSGHPAGADALGPVARDPSYLYQWLMSFPYRISSNVIFLRFINIGLFAAGLPLYRRLLLRTGASRAITHFCLALFVLIPIVPLLAAQINYDNLFLPLTALSLLLALNVNEQLSHKRVSLRSLLWLATVLTLTCLVKYAFLPIALVIAVYLLINLRRNYHGARRTPVSRPVLWLLTGLFVVSLGLFTQRYGVNLVRYHKPVPSCDEVLSVRQCSAYGPWSRDYQYSQIKPAETTDSPLVFSADWFYGMWLRTFFAVDGPTTTFATRGPFIMPAIGAIVFSVSALAATIMAWRQVWRRYDRRVLGLFIAATAVYTAALWVDGYRSFLQTGQPVALNGRYLLPVMPMVLVILALGANVYLRSRQQLKLALAGLALICMLWGGGALTYVLRSSDSWYWPDSPLKGANHFVQDNVGPLVPGNGDPLAFMGRRGT